MFAVGGLKDRKHFVEEGHARLFLHVGRQAGAAVPNLFEYKPWPPALYTQPGFQQATVSGSSGNARESTQESDWSQGGLACLPKIVAGALAPENKCPSLTAGN